jgi:hypothetical protein
MSTRVLLDGGNGTQTYVTDPAPTQPLHGPPRCEFKIYPTPDVVEFCENTAVAVLIAPCCGQTANICTACIAKAPSIGSWLCIGCGVKTDCKWTPMTFGIRWL